MKQQYTEQQLPPVVEARLQTAYEQIRRESQMNREAQPVSRSAHWKRPVRAALIAAAAVLSIGGAAATPGGQVFLAQVSSGLSQTQLYQQLFGDRAGEAETLLEDYSVEINEAVSYRDLTVTVTSILADDQGNGIVYYSLDDPNGLSGLSYGDWSGATHAYWDEGTSVIPLFDFTGDETYAAAESCTDTHAELYSCFTVGDGSDTLTLSFLDYSGEELVEVTGAVFTLPEVTASRSYASADGRYTALLSPIGLSLTDTQATGSDELAMAEISLTLADGSSVSLADEELPVLYSCISALDSGYCARFCLNSLLETGQVEAIVINGTVLSA